MNRRDFLRMAGCGAAGLALAGRAAEDLPRVDLHVHLDNSTIDTVMGLSKQLGVKFGIVEHAGTKENKYPVVLASDEELGRYLAMLEGKAHWRGVQAEWIDWSTPFSPAALARLDFVLMDAMTFPGKDGSRVKLWEDGVETRVDFSNLEAFMDRFVDWHVGIIEKQPVDILGNASWLPKPLEADYDKFWTPARVRKVADAAAKHGVAIEISSRYLLPRPGFLKVARESGVKFAFGTNGRYPNMGKIDFSLKTAADLGLKASDIYIPSPGASRAGRRK